jgi:hypothetical protein
LQLGIWDLRQSVGIWRFNRNPEGHSWGSWELSRKSRVLLPAKDIDPTKNDYLPTVTFGDNPKQPGLDGKFPRPHNSRSDKTIELTKTKT